MAISIAVHKEMMKMLRRFLKKKGLELIAGKTKAMVFKKSTKGRKKKIELS